MGGCVLRVSCSFMSIWMARCAMALRSLCRGIMSFSLRASTGCSRQSTLQKSRDLKRAKQQRLFGDGAQTRRLGSSRTSLRGKPRVLRFDVQRMKYLRDLADCSFKSLTTDVLPIYQFTEK